MALTSESSAGRALARIIERSGIDFERLGDEDRTGYRAKEFERNKGFVIEIVETTTRFFLSFSLESAAADLARSIRKNVEETIDQVELITTTRLISETLVMRVNDLPIQGIREGLATQTWRSFSIEDVIDKPLDEDLLKAKVESTLTIVLASLPTEEIEPDFSVDTEFEIEGALKTGSITKYERSPKNRRICLALFGYDCRVCGINLEDKYGPIAQEFIHVHHIVPLSRLDGPMVIDPQIDLIPVCPNCHYVMHRIDPPLHPEILAKDL